MVILVEGGKSGYDDNPDVRLQLLWFFRGTYKNPNQIKDFKHTVVLKPGIPSTEQPKDDDIDAIDVEWQSRGATVVGLHDFDPNGTWSAETNRLIYSVLELKKDETVTVRFRIPHIIQDVSSTFNFLAPMNANSYIAYPQHARQH